MDYKKLLAQIPSKNWYRQGAAVKPLYISYPLVACSHFTVNHKQILPYFEGYLDYFDNGFMNYYFTDVVAEKIALYYWNKETLSPGFTKKLFEQWQKTDTKIFQQITKKLINFDLKNISKELLAKIFSDFSSAYKNLWQESIFLDAFDIMSTKLLEQTLKKYKINLTDSEKHILVSPTILSWLQKEKAELIKLLKIKLQKRLDAKLQTHAEKWYWISNDYSVTKFLDKEHFSKQLNLLRDNKILKKEQDALLEITNHKKQRTKLIALKKLPKEIVLLSNFLITLNAWRDSRKAFNQMSGNIIQKFAKDFSVKIELPLKNIEFLFYWELQSLFKTNKKGIKAISEKRFKNFLFHCESRSNLDFYYGSQALAVKKLVDGFIGKSAGLKGQVAFPGTITGKAKIINSQNDFHKMKKGDILVAPNTRPEYVPIMKLAGAIISEEGGITCHSAIVSRELKIPCIVGVQGATDNLKDGDIIEVDANKGIVKKIK